MRGLALVAAVVIVGMLGVAGYFAFFNAPEDRFAECRAGQIATGPASMGGPLSLVSETGDAVTDKEMFTKPTLLYFGYTFCPDVCPLDNMRNADAQRILEERGYDIATAFISVDPERDNPEFLRDFTNFFHDDMIGYTGTPEQVKAASQAYKTYYRKRDDGDPEYYLIDHSTFTYLVFPDDGFVDFFRRDETPEQMADRVACFLNKL